MKRVACTPHESPDYTRAMAALRATFDQQALAAAWSPASAPGADGHTEGWAARVHKVVGVRARALANGPSFECGRKVALAGTADLLGDKEVLVANMPDFVMGRSGCTGDHEVHRWDAAAASHQRPAECGRAFASSPIQSDHFQGPQPRDRLCFRWPRAVKAD